MHITILTVGSRGDIQPYVALALGLQAVGHRVRVATEKNYQDFVCDRGLEFALLPGDSRQRHFDEDWLAFLESDCENVIRYLRKGVPKFVIPQLPEQMQAVWAACQGTEAIISMPQVPTSFSVAEKLKVPIYMAWTTASTRTTAFPHPMLKTRSLNGVLNALSYDLVDWMYLGMIRKPLNRLRKEILGLSPIPPYCVKSSIPTLYSYSPAFLPKPEDWSDRVHVTGYWFLETPKKWTPPKALLEFLKLGAPPVYVGFGSMTDRDPVATTRLMLDAIAQTGRRAILASGWAGLGTLEVPESVFQLKTDVPFEWLFPQTSAVVHHGGSGTVAEVLRAGVPSVAVYQTLSDQCFVGHRIAELGIGAAPIAWKDLTVERLATAIQTTVTDPTFRTKAANLGAQVRTETGVANAVAAFHQHLPIKVEELVPCALPS